MSTMYNNEQQQPGSGLTLEMEPSSFQPTSPMDMIDDGAFPCKGCGEILEEGKAFELAGNRWHIDCFRCNTCGTLLDSDANLLLLGDGSLICNNCTYSCSACGNKIEDLAILTGDQAFCAGCFRCRNCKRKIENLRYARTSQGIFCMSCHESLMARRRKKARNQPAKSTSNNQLALDKALPVPPPEGGIPLRDDTSSQISSPPPRQGSLNRNAPSAGPSVQSPAVSSPGYGVPPRISPYGGGATSSLQDNSLKDGGISSLTEPVHRNGSKASNRSKRQSMYSHSETASVSNDSYGSYFPLVLDEGPPPPIPNAAHFAEKNDKSYVPVQPGTIERSSSVEKDHPHTSLIKKEETLDNPKSEANTRLEKEHSREQRELEKKNRLMELEHNRERMQEAQIRRQYELEMEREKDRDRQRLRLARDKERDLTPGRTSRESERTVPPRGPRTHRDSPRSDNLSFDDDWGDVPILDGKDDKAPLTTGKSTTDNTEPVQLEMQKETPTKESIPQLPIRKEVPSPKPSHTASSSITSNVDKTNFKLSEVPRTKKATPRLPLEDEDDNVSEQNETSMTFSPEPTDVPILPPPPKQLEHPLRSQSLPRTISASDDKLNIKPDVPPRKSMETPTRAFHSPSPSTVTGRSHPTSRAGSEDTGAGTEVHLGSEFSANSGTTSATTVQSSTDMDKFTFSTREDLMLTQSPPPPPRAFHRSNVSAASSTGLVVAGPAAGPAGTSPVLPPFRPATDMSFEEEMGKIFGTDASSAMLRKVSNAVKHGRSYSDIASPRTMHSGSRWPRSPSVGSAAPFVLPYGIDLNLASPTSIDPKEENTVLKNALRRSTQHIAELEIKLHTTSDLQDLENNIQEQKTTVASLETQREQTMLELSVLRERMTNVDEQTFDINEFKSEIIKGLAKELEELKASFAPQIEALIIQRNALQEEVGTLARKRDQVIQETEQLNSKNMQLADLNNELTRRIQGVYHPSKPDMPDTPRTNGLGIFQNNQLSDNSSETLKEIVTGQQRPIVAQQASSVSANGTSVHGSELSTVDDSGTVMTAQHVVGMRKPTAQAKKFNWKKGGQAVKGVGKAFNKVFASDAQQNFPESYAEQPTVAYAQAYNASPYGAPPSSNSENQKLDAYGQGVFNTQRGGGLLKKLKANNLSSTTTDKDVNVVPLLGSELEARVEYEGRRIPLIVTKCLEEVETRGLDQEGIYRKGGGASQMRMIQEAFDRGENIDLEDPSIDICAVTSVLKQYFRKLPTPLITYDVYDRMVEAAREPDDERKRNIVKVLINELPSLNRDILFFIINHLTKVVAFQAQNLMNSRNLAVVFAPTLMRDLTGEFELRDTHAKNEIVQFILDNSKAIFAGVDL